jgi:CopG family nickel-responsive transcriptional regulator
MPIVSISLNEKNLNDLDHIQKELGFSGRSEVIRAGIRSLLAEYKEDEKLSGKIEAVLLLVHSRHAEESISALKHQFEDIVKTQIHNNIKDEKCLEIFMLNGDAKRVKELIRLVKACSKLEVVKLILA